MILVGLLIETPLTWAFMADISVDMALVAVLGLGRVWASGNWLVVISSQCLIIVGRLHSISRQSVIGVVYSGDRHRGSLCKVIRHVLAYISARMSDKSMEGFDSLKEGGIGLGVAIELFEVGENMS